MDDRQYRNWLNQPTWWELFGAFLGSTLPPPIPPPQNNRARVKTLCRPTNLNSPKGTEPEPLQFSGPRKTGFDFGLDWIGSDYCTDVVDILLIFCRWRTDDRLHCVDFIAPCWSWLKQLVLIELQTNFLNMHRRVSYNLYFAILTWTWSLAWQPTF